jgi:hypothetical protein
MKAKQWAVVFALGCGVLTSGGCALFLVGAGVVVGAGTVAYEGGELKAAENVSMDKGWNASLHAMQDLEFKVTESQKDALAGKIVARRADTTRIIVQIRRQTDQVTEFRIRIGTFGDEALSHFIYEKIKNHF